VAPAVKATEPAAASALAREEVAEAGQPSPEPATQPQPAEAVAQQREPAREQPRGAQPKPPKAEEHRARSRLADSAAEETIRVATNKLDALMTQAGELLVAGLKIDQRLQEVLEIHHAIEDWTREWLKVRATYNYLLHDSDHEETRPLLKFLDTNQQRLKTLAVQASDLQRGFAGDALHLARVTNDLGEGVMKVRMLPVSTVLDMFPRMVRDLSREKGKEVDLQIEGGETELDRKVLEEIKDPLMHLLRNAIDHGLEAPEVREQAGKPRRGTIVVSAFQKGNNIVIEVHDDGAGINVQRVKKTALKAGLITTDEFEAMTDEEAFRLIFTAGLSTSPVVTDTSGRGVGMDVVRKNVEGLRGQVDVDSTPGQGTKITLILPLTLATTQELLVQVGDQTFGLPISAVERIQRINAQDIFSIEGREAIVVDSEPVSLVHLGEVLGLPRGEENGKTEQKLPVVILSSAKKRIAFLVDAVVGQQESVVKSLGKQLSRVPNIAGATILGTGQVIMTLNPVDLTMSARTTESRSSSAARTAQAQVQAEKRPTVLVVDDSLTTRTLEKNILETAGYDVKVATDGKEALDILQSDGCDLVVSDVLMPRMNGLELTESIRGNAKLKELPIVLVTSLDSREDRERGIELGANAYVVKSNFEQANFLQTIEQFV
jgi:two-component system chemotaxis sensor kinase CheA